MFPETKSREILRLEGNKIHCSPSYIAKENKKNFEKHAKIPATTSGHL